MAKKELKTGQSFTTNSLAREISALSADVNGKTKFSIQDSAEMVGYMKEAITNALAEGQKVQITGFLSIVPTYRKPRVGNNVLTGEKIQIKESVAFSTKPGKMIKDVVASLDKSILKFYKEEAEKKSK